MSFFKSRWILLVLIMLCSSLPVFALESPSTLGVEQAIRKLLQDKLADPSLHPRANDTLQGYESRIQAALWDALGEAPAATMAKVNEQAPQAVAGKTTATTPPEGFPERVRESIADFLPLLGLSMDAVSTSDDRKSVSLKLNPLKFEHGELSFAAAAAQPEVFKPILDNIIESSRDQEQKNLLTRVKDLDDVTFALAYGVTRRGLTWDGPRHLYGRDYALYQKLIDGLSKSSWTSVDQEMRKLAHENFIFHQKILASLHDLLRRKAEEQAKAQGSTEEVKNPVAMDTTFSDLRRFIASRELSFSEEEVIAGLVDEAVNLGDLDKAMKQTNFDALPSLIDNQPQIVFTLSHRATNEIVGPESTTLTARYELGSRNFNAVLREYQNLRISGEGPDAARLKAYRNVVDNIGRDIRGEDKLILSLSYKWVNDYSFDYAYTQTLLDPTGNPGTVIDRRAQVMLGKNREWDGNLTYTRFLLTGSDPANKTGVDLPRLTMTVEAVQLQDDPKRQNRVIGKLSYVQSTTKNVSIPITLTWASRPEFLGQQNRTFGAHLGLTYKLGGTN
jgi:hypothetical protein